MITPTACMWYGGDYVLECIMLEENTYLIPGDWATGNALFRVSQQALPGVELLTRSRFRIGLSGP